MGIIALLRGLKITTEQFLIIHHNTQIYWILLLRQAYRLLYLRKFEHDFESWADWKTPLLSYFTNTNQKDLLCHSQFPVNGLLIKIKSLRIKIHFLDLYFIYKIASFYIGRTTIYACI